MSTEFLKTTIFSNNTMLCYKFNTGVRMITKKDFYKKFLRTGCL